MSILSQAINFATIHHDNVLDKGGQPYILHSLRVMTMAQQLGLDEDAQAIGVLHDVVEDPDELGHYVDLRIIKQNFNQRVVAGVDAMTRRNKHLAVNGVDETYFEFVQRCALNPDARKIKLIDNADNMRPERKVPGLKLEDRYEKAARILWEAESLEVDGNVNSYTEFQSKFDKVVTWV